MAGGHEVAVAVLGEVEADARAHADLHGAVPHQRRDLGHVQRDQSSASLNDKFRGSYSFVGQELLRYLNHPVTLYNCVVDN